MSTTGRPPLRHWFFLSLALLAGSTIIANAQLGGASSEKPRPQLEYLNQDIQANLVVESLNELDKQGWDVFTIIPVWKFENQGGDNSGLIPQSYQVFGRRPVQAAK